ncbi:MAG TPA: type I polyketide synthase, partial [Ktedonobacteraceae bacterium]|nr:type I polyketide synthase [Ktedonobacteraceae bacterium]
SYTAPGLDGQAGVIAGALSYAGVDVETINYLETHGTATRLGDAVELAAMMKAFGARTQKKQFCAIGSVKPNVGHLDRAAGVAGLIKTALALHHRQLPPSLNFERANPDVDLENSPFYVNTRLSEWAALQPDIPRRAGVSSFGLGGTNAHVVLEEAPSREHAASARPWHLLLLSARSETALQSMTANLASHLRTQEALALPDIAYTLQVGRTTFNHRRFVLGRDQQEVLAALEKGTGIAESAHQSRRDRPVIFLFPDLGEHYMGMAREFYKCEAAFCEAIDHCDLLLRARSGIRVRELLLSSGDALSSQEQAPQILVFVVEYALSRLLLSWGIQPSAMLGHKLGNYVAGCISGVLTLEDAFTLLLVQTETPEAVLQKARRFVLQAPAIPFISVTTGTWITPEEATDPAYWARHASSLERLADGVAQILQREECILLEIGTGSSLATLIQQHPAWKSERAILSTLPVTSDFSAESALLTALGQLWLSGVTIDWSGFYAGERRYRVPLPTYPFERQRYWVDPPQTKMQPKRQEEPLKGKKPDMADWFYIPTWQQVALPSSAQSRTQKNAPWLLFEDNAGIGQQIAQRLLDQKHPVIRVQIAGQFAHLAENLFTLRPGEPADYRALFETLDASGQRPGTIVHCWSITRDTSDTAPGIEAFQALQEVGFYSLLAMARGLGSRVDENAPRVLVVSNELQAVSAGEQIQPAKATLLGVCKVLAQENINLICRSIDVTLHNDEILKARQIDQLLAEVTSAAADPVVAYREEQRWVQAYQARRLEAISPENKSGSDQPFHRLRQQGVYLITGGMGGVGPVLAEYLARTVQARIVLLGRSSFLARDAWDAWLQAHDANDRISRKICQLQAIEASGGEVLILQASVENEAQMSAAIEAIHAHFGALHGVIHA